MVDYRMAIPMCYLELEWKINWGKDVYIYLVLGRDISYFLLKNPHKIKNPLHLAVSLTI
jgi:hypothetical protein